MTDIHQMNAVKSVLAVRSTASRSLSSSRSARLPGRPAVIMVAGGIAGGYVGAATARRVDQRYVRSAGHGHRVGHDRVFLPAMKAMVLTRPGTEPRSGRPRDADRAAGRAPHQGARVRRLPDRSAHRRRRAARCAAADRARPRDRRRGRADRRRRRGVSPSAIASACRGSATPATSAGFCRERRENLCREARFTGYQLDGGYAEYAVADARYTFKLPDGVRRCRGGAASVCRADRLSVVPDGRRSPDASGSTDSAPRRTSSRRSPCTRRARSTRSRRPATRRPSSLR